MILAAATQVQPYSALTASDASAELRSEPIRRITPISMPRSSGHAEGQDTVTLSQTGFDHSRADRENDPAAGTTRSEQKSAPSSSRQLSPEEQQAVLKLKQRDLEVKAHEAAHLANAGQYAAGGPSYTYQTGPDGRRYAVGGEVPIDISKEKTPEQTVQKMRIVRRAALAPANPSSADRNIAAAAGTKEAEALRELNSPKQKDDSSRSPGNLSISSSDDPAPDTLSQPSRSRSDFQATYA